MCWLGCWSWGLRRGRGGMGREGKGESGREWGERGGIRGVKW